MAETDRKDDLLYPLNGQDTEPFKEISFGRSNLGKSGCGVLAVCNALWILGYDADLQSVKNWFEKNGLMFGAVWGVRAKSVTKYLRKRGLFVRKKQKGSTYDKELEKADCAILMYLWRRGKNCGGHYVTLKKTEEGVLIYNLYRNSKQTYQFASVDEFLHSGYKKTALRVYFINGKKETGEQQDSG